MIDTNQEKEYIKNKGCKCPVCGSKDIEYSGFNGDGNIVTTDVTCNGCGETWTDCYTLTHIEQDTR